MKSKERVLTAFAHQEPDRVPINYSANPGIDRRLKEYFGLNPEDHEGLRTALGVDFRGVGSVYVGQKLHKDIPGRKVTDWGVRSRWMENEYGGYWEECDFPLRNADEQTINDWPLPSPDDYDYSKVVEQCKHYQDYCIQTGGPGTGCLQHAGFLRAMDQILIDLITDDPAGLRLIDRIQEIQLEVARRTIETAKGGIDLLWLGEDLGTQNSPLIGIELYRKHFRPRHQKFIDLAKAYGLCVVFHTCGSSSWAYDDFIKMGIDVVDTLQPEAKDMAPAYLKKKFGDKLAFHGCISTAGPVASGTVEETINNVRETLEVMMPGGGYALAPTHSLQDNSPTENVLAMYQTAKKIGCY